MKKKREILKKEILNKGNSHPQCIYEKRKCHEEN